MLRDVTKSYKMLPCLPDITICYKMSENYEKLLILRNITMWNNIFRKFRKCEWNYTKQIDTKCNEMRPLWTKLKWIKPNQ